MKKGMLHEGKFVFVQQPLFVLALKAPLPPLCGPPPPCRTGEAFRYGILASPVATGEVANAVSRKGRSCNSPFFMQTSLKDLESAQKDRRRRQCFGSQSAAHPM